MGTVLVEMGRNWVNYYRCIRDIFGRMEMVLSQVGGPIQCVIYRVGQIK